MLAKRWRHLVFQVEVLSKKKWEKYNCYDTGEETKQTSPLFHPIPWTPIMAQNETRVRFCSRGFLYADVISSPYDQSWDVHRRVSVEQQGYGVQ